MKKTRLAALLSLSVMSAQAAQYNVVEIATTDKGQSTFPTDINSSGRVAVNVQNLYKPSIDVSLINFELQSLVDNLTDIEAAKAGDLNDADYSLLYSYINSGQGNLRFQQIAQFSSYSATDNSLSLLPGFNLLNNETGVYDTSSNTNVRGLNDAGYTVGASQGGFYKLPYTFEDGKEGTFVLNDFFSRAFAQLNGNIIELPPLETTAGGLSDAFDINVNNQVVGYGTTELASETFKTSVEDCADDTERGDIPIEACLRNLSMSLSANVGQIAQRRGLIWQLDDQGNVISTKQLGMLYTPEEDDTRIFASRAVAINDNGVAVGESPALFRDTEILTSAAAIYMGDEVLTINADADILSSTATAINNQDQVVGYITKRINGFTRRKFFVHDINSDLTTYPQDFFLGSSSVATDINNNGLVVGYAEVETSLNNRRNTAFLYDINEQTFTDIAKLLPCNSPYIIQQANAINDNNEIVATAVKKGPARNILGEIVLDSDGVEVQTDIVVAVKLKPVSGGSVEQCEVIDTVNRDRQGAGVSWLLGLALLVFGFRRQHRLTR